MVWLYGEQHVTVLELKATGSLVATVKNRRTSVVKLLSGVW